MAQPIEMPFWGLIQVGPRNIVFDGVEIPTGRGNFGGCLVHCNALGVPACCSVYSKSDNSVLNISVTANYNALD